MNFRLNIEKKLNWYVEELTEVILHVLFKLSIDSMFLSWNKISSE